MDYREQIIDEMAKGGVTTKPGEIRVFKEVIESMDNKVIQIANLRAKERSNENNEAVVNAVAEALKQAARGGLAVPTNRTIKTPDDIIPDDIVDGELDISPEPLSLDEFNVGGNKDV